MAEPPCTGRMTTQAPRQGMDPSLVPALKLCRTMQPVRRFCCERLEAANERGGREIRQRPLSERTSAATGVRSIRETASLILAEPLTACTRHISAITRSRRRADLDRGLRCSAQVDPHHGQKCWGTISTWSDAATSAWQAGHRSRSPQPGAKHDTRDTSLHGRLKYGASLPARHSGQHCIQVERFLCALSCGGSRSAVMAVHHRGGARSGKMPPGQGCLT